MSAAIQGAEALLRRAVSACLLGEDLAYENGETVKQNIAKLVPQVNPETVRDLAIHARVEQKLRHVPLFLAVEMLKHATHRPLVGELLPKIIQRADELAEFLSIYWSGGKTPIAKQAKIGLAEAFHNFSEYHFAKYDRDEDIKLRDVMFMTHPKPRNRDEEALYTRIAGRSLETPDTWEVLYSQAKSDKDKQNVWMKLISEGKLGALAFVRNMRNMVQADVPSKYIRGGLKELNPQKLLPLNIITAAQYAPAYTRDLEDLFFRAYLKADKLPGKTIFVVDVSGSMGQSISGKSMNSRLDVAYALSMLAAEMCEDVRFYVTAGSDHTRVHKTEQIPAYRGFGLVEALRQSTQRMGGGGIFTRQCIDYIREQEKEADRIIVFSDSQDCDRDTTKLPNPFGKTNYIVDVSAHSRGINYAGVWTTEISGWSESFFDFILANEGVSLQEEEDLN